MAARSIKEGDKVRIHMSSNSSMRESTWKGIWTVNWTPGDVGDTWTFERDGKVIKVNPCSANFDGLELVEKEEATNGS